MLKRNLNLADLFAAKLLADDSYTFTNCVFNVFNRLGFGRPLRSATQQTWYENGKAFVGFV
jgi:hypothetical protein